MNIIKMFLLLLIVAGLVSCAPAISEKFRQKIQTPLNFTELRLQPEKYVGKEVILGGYILDTVNEPDKSLLIVLQAPLGYRDEPKDRDLSKGRFLVETKQFIDPEVYNSGRKITVGGTVAGSEEQELGNATYSLPVIEAVELHLWPEEKDYYRPYYPHRYPYYLYPYDYPYHPYHYPYYPYYHHNPYRSYQ
jgi:outer membrane lipoprotein